MQAAGYQMIARPGDVGADAAAAGGARILVVPELATTGYGAGEAILSLAETADGRTRQ
jgi:predicted amidohydrolase